jgi:hypothetical protein
MRAWSESALPQEILDAIKEKGYKKPSPIREFTVHLERVMFEQSY